MNPAHLERREKLAKEYAAKVDENSSVLFEIDEVAKAHVAGYDAGRADGKAEGAGDAKEAARVELMEAIFSNIKEIGVEDTLAWLKSRFGHESRALLHPEGKV